MLEVDRFISLKKRNKKNIYRYCRTGENGKFGCRCPRVRNGNRTDGKRSGTIRILVTTFNSAETDDGPKTEIRSRDFRGISLRRSDGTRFGIGKYTFFFCADQTTCYCCFPISFGASERSISRSCTVCEMSVIESGTIFFFSTRKNRTYGNDCRWQEQYTDFSFP